MLELYVVEDNRFYIDLICLFFMAKSIKTYLEKYLNQGITEAEVQLAIYKDSLGILNSTRSNKLYYEIEVSDCDTRDASFNSTVTHGEGRLEDILAKANLNFKKANPKYSGPHYSVGVILHDMTFSIPEGLWKDFVDSE